MVKTFAIGTGLFVIPSYALFGPGVATFSALYACGLGYLGIGIFHMNRIFLPIVQVRILTSVQKVSWLSKEAYTLIVLY